MTEATEREIRIYVTSEGKAPFEDWVTALRDKRAKARILSRIDRVRLGNFGDCRSAGAGDIKAAHRHWKEQETDAYKEL